MTTYTDRDLERSPEKAKSLLMETLQRFQEESFTQYEVENYMNLLVQAIQDSNGFSAFRSYLLDET